MVCERSRNYWPPQKRQRVALIVEDRVRCARYCAHTPTCVTVATVDEEGGALAVIVSGVWRISRRTRMCNSRFVGTHSEVRAARSTRARAPTTAMGLRDRICHILLLRTQRRRCRTPSHGRSVRASPQRCGRRHARQCATSVDCWICF
jgi:hypothetical protein